MSEEPQQVPQENGFKRACLLVAGSLFTALALVGALLPVLPTTPFLIVAAACFARSSPAFHRRLHSNRAFGPYLVQWERDHTIPREAKLKAYGLVTLSFTLSILLIDAMWLRAMLVVVGTTLIVFLAWLPVTPEEQDGE